MPRGERGAQNFEKILASFKSNPKCVISLQLNPHSVIVTQLCTELSLQKALLWMFKEKNESEVFP